MSSSPVNSRDIWVIIRARDQASNVIRGMATGMMGDLERVAGKTRAQVSQNAVQMARIRNQFGQRILQMQAREIQLRRQGDTAAAQMTRMSIQDEKMRLQQQMLSLQQAQIGQRQKLADIAVERQRRRMQIESRMETVRAGGAMVAFGSAMAIAGVVGLKAFTNLVRGAAEYERQAALTFTQVHNSMDTATTSIEDLQAISNRVAQRIGVPFERLQVALYDIFSSTDMSVQEAERTLEAFAKAAVAGQVDIQDAGRATLAMFNAFGEEGYSINRLLDIQFKSVQLGSMTYEEFARTVGRAIPAVKATGQSVEFLAGSAAFLTRNGQSAAMAMTAIARGSEMFLRKPVQANLRAMGIEALDASGKLRPINELLSEMAPHFVRLDTFQRKRLFEKIFGGQNFAQARRFFDLAITKADQLSWFINQAGKSSGSFMSAYRTMADTVAVKTQVLSNNWKIFTTSIGKEGLPAMDRFLNVGIGVLNWLNALSPAQKRVIAEAFALGAALTTIAGVLVAVAGAVKVLGGAFAILRLSAVVSSFTATTVAATTMTGVFATALAGTSSLTAALGGLGIALAVAATANSALSAAQSAGASIHEKYVRPFYESIHLADKATGENMRLRSSTRESAAAMYESSKAVGAASQATGGYGNAIETAKRLNVNYTKSVQQVIQVTEEEEKKMREAASRIISSGISGLAAQQDKIAEATRNLRDAQADLARVQGGTNTVVSAYSPALERVHDASVRVEKAQIALRDKAKDSRVEHIRLREAQHDLTVAQGRARESNSKSVTSNDELKNAVQRVKDAQKALKEAVGETARETMQRFIEEEKAARTWSKNMRTLLARGVDPQLVAELAEKGPRYTAQFVNLSDKELRRLVRLWRAKNSSVAGAEGVLMNAMKGNVDGYIKYQIFKNLQGTKAWKRMTVEQKEAIAKAMKDGKVDVVSFQAAVNRLKGKSIKIKAIAEVVLAESTRLYFKTASAAIREKGAGAKGGYVNNGEILRRAAGGPITGPGTSTSDSIPAYGPNGARYRLSNGEYIVNAKATRKYRPLIEQINAEGRAAGGPIGQLSEWRDSIVGMQTRLGRRIAHLYQFVIQRGLKYFIESAVGGGSTAIKQWIKAQDPKPYIWGAAGPGGFDCSGIVSAVLGKMLGMRGAGSGLRLFTTGTIRAGQYGLRPGLGGTLQIGVTAGTGHMAGRYGGLGFEAESSRTGIKIGRAASRPESFARHYHHMAAGGYVNDREKQAIAQMVEAYRLNVWGDADNAFAMKNGRTRRFHSGGRLPEDVWGFGPSGQTYSLQGGETVSPRGEGGIHLHFHGPVYGGKAGVQQLADDVLTALARKANTHGGTINVRPDRRAGPVIR